MYRRSEPFGINVFFRNTPAKRSLFQQMAGSYAISEPGSFGRETDMKMRAILTSSVLLAAAAAALAAGPSIYEAEGKAVPRSALDRAIFANLRSEGIEPARLCSDSVFLRRVHLDLIGTLPTPERVESFLADNDPDKRAKLIETLLKRPELADYWAIRWGDLLCVRSEFPINLWPNAVQAYHRWFHTAIRDNMPYDRFAYELLTASGSNFRVAPVNFYRAVQTKDAPTIAKSVALVFMGDRMTTWPEARREQMAVFFQRVGFKPTREWKEEIVFFDRTTPHTPSATLPDGTTVRIGADVDPRTVFADWLVDKNNPWLARAMVNRTWAWMFGRGLIHEPDDIREDNKPVCPEALAVLEKQFVASGYDFRDLLRTICNSTTYQLSCVPASDDPRAAQLFACYPLRRLDAEVLIDALCRITDTSEQYHSRIPEPFTWVPTSERTIALQDGSITSSFLELFGRPSRDSHMMSSRSNAITAGQMLHMLNSSHVREKIERGPMMRSLRRRAGREPAKAVDYVYRLVLSRKPTADELQAIKAYTEDSKTSRHLVAIDLLWALINSPEFLYRH
jgi:hypothetical protein